ncbi:hypothetical protein EUTSA_v10005463mg [Eutrema salsugineum]|uniref:Phorbol-ester/DAG-type domain-containing protein n=1 Tax=Eutrema salsugineum TaxID=72664 RepID=V4MND2_EUTSA|nr:hypothetical protein EUTSA_v10005463mg [Eutrema salsugineum]
MNLVGEFHKVITDGKPYLVYHNVEYSLPQIQSPNSSTKAAIDSGGNPLLEPLFLCPGSRWKLQLDQFYDTMVLGDEFFVKFQISPLFDDDGHHVLPLFWCNNKEADPHDIECHACMYQKVGSYYYFCAECDKRYHQECIESPLDISYPYHLQQSFQLYVSARNVDHCFLCRKELWGMVYYSSLCDISMHILCAQATIPFLIDHPKKHDHTLTLFPRQACLACNVCATVNKLYPTYRLWCIHLHCRGYAVHTRCALRTDICDGQELEGMPEEDDIYQNVEPFQRISDGIILHISHDHHHMRFETSRVVYEGNNVCQACALPIYEGNFYACVECDFLLHEACACAPRIMLHPLHPHPLKLGALGHEYDYMICCACTRMANGFTYMCTDQYCGYRLDVRCALVSEPFQYQGHQRPLFLSLDPKEKPSCHICKAACDVNKVLNCIECDFIICFSCATLPYTVKYKHDEHYLTFCRGDEASGSDWCELCEGKLTIGGKQGFYKCDDCCTTLHIHCLLGFEPYMVSGPFSIEIVGKMQLLPNNLPTRPTCNLCHSRCPYPTFFTDGKTTICSFKCAVDHSYFD